MRAYETAELIAQTGPGQVTWLEFLRVPALSAGLYRLPAGATDPQEPHTEDELYYVVQGRARFRAGTDDREVHRARCSMSRRASSTASTASKRIW